jgi:antirestriction protein ArdC
MHEKTQASFEKLLALFESDEVPGVAAQATLIERQKTGAPSERWSLSNRMLMLLNNTSDARTFNQWKEAGRFPKKGAKGFHIFTPNTVKAKVIDEESGEEEYRRVFKGTFGTLNLFRVEDTEGDPVEVENPDYTPEVLPSLYDVAEELGVSVVYAPAGEGRRRGFYSPSEKLIALGTHDERTFFHELVHRADHLARGKIACGQESNQEITAEVCAATLCLLYGIEGYTASSRDYIEGYDRKGNGAAKAALRVIRRVQDALKVILNPEERERVLAQEEEDLSA